MTASSTPSSRAHSLADRTPFPPLRNQPSSSRNRRQGTACSHVSLLKAPTDRGEEPEKALAGRPHCAGGGGGSVMADAQRDGRDARANAGSPARPGRAPAKG